jgi:hypothetical protein
MLYGSLFWDRYVKDAGIASFLSLGWNLGFVREFGGAAMEAVTRPVGAVGRATGIQGLTPSQQRQTIRDNTSKMGFAFTYLLTAALINGLMSYLLSGKAPEGWDFIFARVGGENPDGSPRRITNMTYLREIPMLIKHVQEHGGNILAGAREMLWTKLMFEPLKEILENRDYFGYNIRDENAPWYKQVWQTIAHGFGSLVPISVSSAEHALDTGGTWSKDAVLAVLGFGPAPSYAEKSAIQNRISYLYNEHVAPSSRTYAEGEVSHDKMRARTRLLQALHSKDPEQIKQARADAIKAGYSVEAVNAIGRTPSDVLLFSKLPEADQQAILRQANAQEFDRYINHAHMKLRKPMRDERAGKQAEAAAPAPSSAPAPRPLAPLPRPATPPPSRPPPAPRPMPSPPRRLPGIEQSANALSEQIESIVSPNLRRLRSSYSELADKRGEVLQALGLHRTLKDLEERKDNLEREDATSGSTTNIADIDLSTSTVDKFSTVVLDLLKQWHFPAADRVHFDMKARDLVINGKNRTSFGKGLRAITQAAFTIGLLEHCCREDTPHPGFAVLDSPLLSYREPDNAADDLRGTDLNTHFYRYLQRTKNDRQIVIIESTDPPADVQASPQALKFTGLPNIGRFGLFPLAAQRLST